MRMPSTSTSDKAADAVAELLGAGVAQPTHTVALITQPIEKYFADIRGATLQRPTPLARAKNGPATFG